LAVDSSWPVVRSAPASVTVSPVTCRSRHRPQPEAQGRLFTPFFITVGLVEAAYFINLAFMALFVFATPISPIGAPQ
jgi:hypothetical protein